MPHHHLHPGPATQTLRQSLREIDRAMLAARTTERHHQACKAATLIIVYARIHERHNTGEKLMHALLLIEKVNHRRVFARQSLKSLLASGIRYAAGIENKSATVTGLVFR